MRLQGGRSGDGACRRGLMLIELMTATALMAVIVLGILGAIGAQGRNAILLARETRTRLLLEGEMEWLRGRAAAQIQPCLSEAFTPALGVPDALAGVSFRRTIAVEDEGRIARVQLSAALSAGRVRRRVLVEGVLFLQEQ